MERHIFDLIKEEENEKIDYSSQNIVLFGTLLLVEGIEVSNVKFTVITMLEIPANSSSSQYWTIKMDSGCGKKNGNQMLK